MAIPGNAGSGSWGLPLAITFCIIAVVALVILAVLRSSKKAAELRAKHLSDHEEIPAEAFLKLVGLPAEQGPVALQMRDLVALMMAVPSVTVHASDTLEYVCRFQFDMDGHELAGLLEEELKTPIPQKLRWNSEDWGKRSIAEIIRHVLQSQPAPR